MNAPEKYRHENQTSISTYNDVVLLRITRKCKKKKQTLIQRIAMVQRRKTSQKTST